MSNKNVHTIYEFIRTLQNKRVLSEYGLKTSNATSLFQEIFQEIGNELANGKAWVSRFGVISNYKTRYTGKGKLRRSGKISVDKPVNWAATKKLWREKPETEKTIFIFFDTDEVFHTSYHRSSNLPESIKKMRFRMASHTMNKFLKNVAEGLVDCYEFKKRKDNDGGLNKNRTACF